MSESQSNVVQFPGRKAAPAAQPIAQYTFFGQPFHEGNEPVEDSYVVQEIFTYGQPDRPEFEVWLVQQVRGEWETWVAHDYGFLQLNLMYLAWLTRENHLRAPVTFSPEGLRMLFNENLYLLTVTEEPSAPRTPDEAEQRLGRAFAELHVLEKYTSGLPVDSSANDPG